MSLPSRLGTSKRSISHLLLAGHNSLSGATSAAPSHPTLTPIPFGAWLGSIGRADDVHNGWRLLPSALASGQGHSLIGYRSLGVDRCFGVGRNESAQLGVGFASQEGTRGLVEGFEGEEVLATAGSCQSSYILVRQEERNALYTFGSLARGRLGQPGFFPLAQLDEGEEPVVSLLSQATRVPLPPLIGNITHIAVGFEHVLILTEDGQVWGTGCNTDGQLGLGSNVMEDVHEFAKVDLPEEVIKEGGVAGLRAGADTSALITKSGKVWSWGNSEYGQGLHGRKIDQISAPLAIDHSFLPSARRIVDYRCGGSFGLVLDDTGEVYSAGYGALGQGPDLLSSIEVKRIDGLEGIDRLRAGFGFAAAIRDQPASQALFTWGLNSPHGRLGHGRGSAGGASSSTPPPAPSAHHPTEVALPLKQLGLTSGDADWRIGEVECGLDNLWVELIEGHDE